MSARSQGFAFDLCPMHQCIGGSLSGDEAFRYGLYSFPFCCEHL